MNRSAWVALGILASGIVGGSGVAVLFTESQKERSLESKVNVDVVPVVSATVRDGAVPIYLRGVGTIVAYNTVVVRSQIQGELVRINFKEGQEVKPTEVLAVIDAKPYQARLDQMIANKARDQAELKNAQTNLDRSTQLVSKGFATQQLLDSQTAQVTQLQNTVASDEAQIEQAQVQLGYTTLRSPISGITGIRQIDIGNIIHPSDANGLVTVTQIEPISLIFTLPEVELTRLQSHMSAVNGLSVLAFSQDDKVLLDEGKVELINNEIIQTTGSIELKATFPNLSHRLWPGQLVNVRLLLETLPSGLTIAASAVQRNQNGPYVYIVKSDLTVETRPVTVSQIVQGQALLSSGVKAGDRIVIDGQYRLQQGSAIRELHGKAAQEAVSQSSVEKEIP
ncbi:efflux RND transporter periplasmic adaptor subunit [Tardiphaga sp. 866_E4_N2_1]|uniref:efflux RND transporter periplasmic adaptor subunit n=1 Tax=unclassified Tardiphaga TaxID=2631404 RepID=UPI003F2577BA